MSRMDLRRRADVEQRGDNDRDDGRQSAGAVDGRQECAEGQDRGRGDERRVRRRGRCEDERGHRQDRFRDGVGAAACGVGGRRAAEGQRFWRDEAGGRSVGRRRADCVQGDEAVARRDERVGQPVARYDEGASLREGRLHARPVGPQSVHERRRRIGAGWWRRGHAEVERCADRLFAADLRRRRFRFCGECAGRRRPEDRAQRAEHRAVGRQDAREPEAAGALWRQRDGRDCARWFGGDARHRARPQCQRRAGRAVLDGPCRVQPA